VNVLTQNLPWRLIPLLDMPGHLQMAIDRWLFEQHCQTLHPPTLRFYTWSPVAISLGYHQRHYPAHWQLLTWQNKSIDLVPRPSGGRAVLHQGDLTYAVITSNLPGNRMQNYKTICQFLIEAWRSLGVTLHYGQAGRGYIHNPNCFGTATGADLVLADGTKFIGSAQLRRGSAVLQHGSMRLNPDPALFQQVFGVDMQPLDWLADTFQTQALSQITEALIDAAIQCFGITLEVKPLTPEEWAAITLIQQSEGRSNRPQLWRSLLQERDQFGCDLGR
jgi:lipoate-protein ligase A